MASRYSQMMEQVFLAVYEAGADVVEFSRDDLEKACETLSIKLPNNVPDTIYSFRHRIPLPDAILETAPADLEWIIEGIGKGRYRFRLAKKSRIVPRSDLVVIKVPDSTPEIIARYALGDEQALLARVRYNRLIDTFLGITTYSLQNHLRTTVIGLGQIEIDEVYVGLNTDGLHFVVPVQAKGGSDQLGVVQTTQDKACCAEKFPQLICRPVSAQFMTDDVIAMFELTVEDDEVLVVQEKHYKLVPSSDLSDDDIQKYRMR